MNEFVEADFSSQHRTYDEFGPIVGVEQAPRLGKIAVDGTRRQRERPCNLLIGVATASKHHAVARAWV